MLLKVVCVQMHFCFFVYNMFEASTLQSSLILYWDMREFWKVSNHMWLMQRYTEDIHVTMDFIYLLGDGWNRREHWELQFEPETRVGFDGILSFPEEGTLSGFLSKCFWNMQIHHTNSLPQGNHILDKSAFPNPPNCQFNSQGKRGLALNWHIFQRQPWQRY